MSNLKTATEAARLLHKSDKTIRAWLHKNRFPHAKIVKLDGLRQWAIPLADIEIVRQEEESTGSTETIPEPFGKIEALERRIAALERAILSRAPVYSGSIQEVPEVLHKSDTSNLPPGFVALADFYHGINHTTLYRFIRNGTIEITVGHWKHNGHAVEKALSPEQQKLFYDRMNKYLLFKACPACPH